MGWRGGGSRARVFGAMSSAGGAGDLRRHDGASGAPHRPLSGQLFWRTARSSFCRVARASFVLLCVVVVFFFFCFFQKIRRGYAVVFLHRKRSQRPFLRWLKEDEEMAFRAESGKVVLDNAEAASQLEELARAPLLSIPFVSVHEYLHLLRGVASLLNTSSALIYACAAVSDFYIPMKKLDEHKIQVFFPSCEDFLFNRRFQSRAASGLTVHLDNVPKMLGELRQSWAPRAFIVSFKLETDETILETKAKASLQSYGQNVVVGNLLMSYRDRVWMRFANGDVKEIVKTPGCDIEELFLPCIIEEHSKHMKR